MISTTVWVTNGPEEQQSPGNRVSETTCGVRQTTTILCNGMGATLLAGSKQRTVAGHFALGSVLVD